IDCKEEGPYRKRGRSPTTSFLPPRKRLRGLPSAVHQETSIEDSTERGFEASIEGSIEIGHEADIEANIEAVSEAGTKVGTEASIGDAVEIAVDVIVKPDTLHVLLVPNIAKQLDDHEEVIQEMYDRLLEMPLHRMEEVKEKIKTLTSRLETDETKRTNLELSELSL
ncbi:hypothetical protein Tco_1129369, partial [Tanacetum coccineum]